MSIISQMVTLAAAGSASKYFVGTYTYTSSSNLLFVDASYEPLDNYALVNFQESNYSVLLGVNLASGAVALSTRSDVDIGSTSQIARSFKRGLDNAGVPNYCCFGNNSSTGPRAPIYKRGTGWVFRQAIGSYPYWNDVRATGSVMSQIGRPVVFGGFTRYDTNDSYVINAYETNNSATNKGIYGGSTGNRTCDVLPYSTDKLIAIATYNNSWPVIYSLTVDSNNAITGVSTQRFLTNRNSNTNDYYKLQYRAANDLLYAAVPAGICPLNASTLLPHSTVTNAVFPSGVPNPASAPTNQQDVKLHYDSVNDCVYFSRDCFVMKLSANLGTIHWAITGNFRGATIYPIANTDGDIIFAALSSTTQRSIIVAQLDKDASQVTSSYTTPLAGVSWQRVTTGMSLNAATCTTSNINFFITIMPMSNQAAATGASSVAATAAKQSL